MKKILKLCRKDYIFRGCHFLVETNLKPNSFFRQIWDPKILSQKEKILVLFFCCKIKLIYVQWVRMKGHLPRYY